ncbi:hypothetical protein RB653_005276 [Dictyostelium firmibasis]|uniref:Transcriptional regulator of RNA polII, SAGA, subunit-domain-containing protein n=1 Tax=Dictyostelium firmibasis TaxID=79012 RepID=A0AAN7UB72_9MYCE
MTKELNSGNSTSLNSNNNNNNGNNIINIPTPYETSLERIDLIPLKKQLDAVLKDRSEDYWEWIRKYLCGRLSKRELDYYVTTNLNEPNLHLHNTFFKAVIFNAFYSKTSPTIIEQTKVPIPSASSNQTSPSLSTTSTSSSLKRKLSTSTNSTKEKKDKKDTSSTSTNPSLSKRKKEKNPTKRPRREKKDSIPITFPSTSLHTLTLKKKQKKKFPKYSLFSSQLQPLKNKMEEIANENGLQGISKQSIIFMKLALEQHILNFLRKTKPHIQLPSQNSIPPNQLPPPSPFSDYFFSNIVNNQSNNNSNNIDDKNDKNSINNTNNVNNHNQEIENEKENEKEKEKINGFEKEQDFEPMALNDDNNTNNNACNEIPLPTVLDQSQHKHNLLPIQQPTTFSFSSIFNFNQFNTLNNNNNDKLELNYPKYVESNNPLLSQSVSFYKIPDNIFSNTPPTSILSTQDIFSMAEDNSLILGNDPLAFERINLFRY